VQGRYVLEVGVVVASLVKMLQIMLPGGYIAQVEFVV
jgi:preprotein translocase subunit Sec61beta